jgi:hypothetical protein
MLSKNTCSKISKEGIRPKWYIKTAIVILGVGLRIKAEEAFGLVTAVMFHGLCAILVTYLIFEHWYIMLQEGILSSPESGLHPLHQEFPFVVFQLQ